MTTLSWILICVIVIVVILCLLLFDTLREEQHLLEHEKRYTEKLREERGELRTTIFDFIRKNADLLFSINDLKQKQPEYTIGDQITFNYKGNVKIDYIVGIQTQTSLENHKLKIEHIYILANHDAAIDEIDIIEKVGYRFGKPNK